MARFELLPGERFGRLVIVAEAAVRGTSLRYFLCRCDCGVEKEIYGSNLRRGAARSCGCLRQEISATKGLKHGGRRRLSGGKKHKLNNVYAHMCNRCHKPESSHYKDYGARGISVCAEWQTDYGAFFKWALANGYAEGLTLERRNNDGNYSPENCYWATRHQQGANKRNNWPVVGVRHYLSLSRNKKYVAALKVDGKRVLYKYFAVFSEAVAARKQAEAQYGIVL